MPRKASGQVVERKRKRGRVFALRFRAGGERQYVTLPDGTSREEAERELRHVLADVERGTWRPQEPAPIVELPEQEPTFHEFASEWLQARELGLRPATVRLYRYQLTYHLLPFFAKHRLSEITVEEVDRYRTAKVYERERGISRMSNGSINKTIGRLAQILAVAVEYGHIDRNPALGQRRRLKAAKPVSKWLDSEQVAPLLRAAGELDAEARCDDTRSRKPLLATLILAGLRVGEALALRWQNVDLAMGRLRIEGAKTDAGVRVVDLSPDLRDYLATHKAGSRFGQADDLVFPTREGRLQNSNNVRNRTLRGAIERANERLAKKRLPLIPAKLKTHELRHTFASLLFEAGATVPYVMDQLGHADPKVTLSIYTHVLGRKPDHGKRLDALVRGADWAPLGTSDEISVAATADFLCPRQDSNLRPAA
jgi:integrase